MATPGACPHEVRPAVMAMRWDQVTFLHWPYAAADVQRLLPPGLVVEEWEGSAWVALVPFLMRVGFGRGPLWSTFCETNVRTYVRDGAGRPGIWFFSLDAADLPAVLAARLAYGLPYFWSAMSLQRSGDLEVRYRCRRRWPGRARVPPPASTVAVELGRSIPPAEVSEFEHFLTARWALFSAGRWGRVRGGPLRMARAAHEPWPLRRAWVERLDDGLVAASGLPRPVGDPLVHFSPGVRVRIGRPQRAPGAGRRGWIR